MSTKHFLLTLLAAFSLAWACQRPEAGLSFPNIDLSLTEASVPEAVSSFTVHVRSNRAWRATSDAEWIAIDPEAGPGSADEQPVTITVQNNTGFNRTGNVVFDIIYDSFTLPVEQAGLGRPEDFLIYYNDFDLEAATQTYGSGTSWPYLDQFGGWKNEKGIGVSGIEYKVGGISCRTNSASDGNYSDYTGSGVNNLLMGSSNYFVVKDMSLNGLKDFRLSFGSEKYDNNNKDSNFDPSEFFIYLSDDGKRWVPLGYDYLGTAAGRWNVAEGFFSVPQGTEKLSLYITTSVSSVYRMDDLKIEAVPTAGTLLDFSLGIEMNPGGDDQPGGDDTPSEYENAPAKTVSEFINLADPNTYYKLTGTVSRFNTQYCSFDLTDDSGTIYVYSVSNKDQWISKIQDGGTVVLAGKYQWYEKNSQHEVVNAYILSFDGGGVTPPSGDVPFTKLDPSNFKEGKYVIAYASGSSFAIMKNAVQANYYVAAAEFDLKAGKAPADEFVFTVAKSGSGYTIKNNEGGYVGVEISGTHYNLKPGLSAPYVWTFTKQADGSIRASGADSGDYVMSYDAAHNDYTLFNKTPSLPTFYCVDGAPSGDTPGGDTPGGDTPDGNPITWVTNADNQTWAAATDATYGAGFSATSGGMTVSYFKGTSTSTPLAPNANHIRVYKNSHLSIKVAGKTITAVELTCEPNSGTTSYCFDLSITGGGTATADKTALKITWSGNAASFEADAVNGQVRIKEIKVTYK